MKKINNLFKKLNNRGSSIVMVIVSLGFIGIVIGALVAAAGYAYRLKLQNLNAKDNFYYVEQAMQEIYAGVGANTIEEMKEAYTYTVENMVRFDPAIGTYVTLDDEEANKMFKKRFMENIKGSPYFSQGNEQLATVLESYITNETVDLDNSKIVLAVQEVVVQEATAEAPAVTREEIVIKNVTLTRIQDYDNVTGGTYVQTISADIVISEPDFAVKFNNMTTDYSAIFEYAIIGDMGVQIVNNDGVDILGNIYAASDFYNKSYNENTSRTPADQKHKYTANGVEYSYNITPVTSKQAEITDEAGNVIGTDYVNQMLDATNVASYKYDGENTYSMNSGLYISNSSVNIMADRVIVPGTVAVMDSSDMLVYGSAGVTAEVWADNIVLGGSSVVTPKSPGSTEITYNGSEAIFSADLYVRDDTEINAKGAKFTLHGSYYGYGNSTSKDTRVFVPTVATAAAAGGDSATYSENYQVPIYDYSTGTQVVTGYENRGHYNSSAFVINGEFAYVDMSNASKIYLAGRAYVELSMDVASTTTEPDEGSDEDSKYTETYTYEPTTVMGSGNDAKTQFVRDYKTGESISIKSNQIMYNISTLGYRTTRVNPKDPNMAYFLIHYGSENVELGIFMQKFFPSEVFGDNNIPCATYYIDGKSMYLIDFDTAYRVLEDYDLVNKTNPASTDILGACKSADDLSAAFAVAYVEDVKNNPNSGLKEVVEYEDFDQGYLEINEDAQVYSSGAISTREGTTFTMVTANGTQNVSDLLNDRDYLRPFYGEEATDVLAFSKELETKYNYLKWNLEHYEDANNEKAFVNDLITKKGEDYLTPINKYLVMNNITAVNTKTVSGYKVVLSSDDIVISDTNALGGKESDVKGIFITKGDVNFDPSVTSFEGIIVAGGKVYVGSGVENITASPNVCRGVIRDCLMSMDTTSIAILSVFKEYEEYKELLPNQPVTPGEGGTGEGGTGEGGTGEGGTGEGGTGEGGTGEGGTGEGGTGEGGTPVIPEEPETPELISIDAIDYSQVVSITNWMKNVGGDYDGTKTP